MNPPTTAAKAGREPLPVELLATADDRRPRVSVEDHERFHRAIAGPVRTRKQSETKQLLAILDEIGKDGEN